jgi:hypothetical protein
MSILPDLLSPGLDLIIVGTAAGRASAKRRAYYAGRGSQEDCNSHEAHGWGARHDTGRPAIASISRALSRALAAEEPLSWLIRGR